MNGNQATASVDSVPDQRSHPAWCDSEHCTWSENGGAHHSAWVTLGPLPNTNIVVRAYLYATDDAGIAPLVMIAVHSAIDSPDDIANNAGIDEDTLAHVVLQPDQVLQLTGLLTMLVATAKGTVVPQVGVPSPR